MQRTIRSRTLALIVTAEPNGAALWLNGKDGLKFLEKHPTVASAVASMQSIEADVKRAQRKG